MNRLERKNYDHHRILGKQGFSPTLLKHKKNDDDNGIQCEEGDHS